MENTEILYCMAANAAGLVIPETSVTMELCSSGRLTVTKKLETPNDVIGKFWTIPDQRYRHCEKIYIAINQ